jgi:MFS family permease
MKLGKFLVSSKLTILACMQGMSLLTLTVSLPSLRPPRCSQTINMEKCKKASTLQLAVFYGALYTLAVGTGGTKPNISTIGADQFDDFNPKEKAHKLSFFNWWFFSIFLGTFFANTVLVWIQDNVGWTLGYALPTLGLAISIAIFMAGTPFYRHKVPAGSPFTRMAKVIVAAVRKWRVRIPDDPKELYELDSEEYAKKGKFRIDSTPTLRYIIYMHVIYNVEKLEAFVLRRKLHLTLVTIRRFAMFF